MILLSSVKLILTTSVVLLTLLIKLSSQTYDFLEQHLSGGPKCEEIKVPLCRGLEYNMTSMPNQLNHMNQDEAGMEAHQFFPLVAINCSSDLRFFVCSMYTPICLPDYNKPLPPCRSVCERAKAGCAPLMLQHGFRWPAHLECSKLPVYGTDELCMDSNQTRTNHRDFYTTSAPDGRQTFHTVHNEFIDNKILPRPIIDDGFKPPISSGIDFNVETGDVQVKNDLDVYEQNILYSGHFFGHAGGSGDCRCSCPNNDQYKSVKTNAGSRMFIYNVSHCTYACHAIKDNDERRVFVRFWVALWACICFACTLLTVCTFFIDMDRFQYPERPIIYLSICYFLVSIGYLIRLMVGHDQIACEGDHVWAATSGPTQCTTVFLLIYFFGMASSVWWVILAFNWFLAAGLKWSSEAISGYTACFHFFAWIVPAVLSISVLSTSSVDGDPYTGVCYVGNTDVNALRLFVLSPLLSCLLLGSFFLLAGFISLVRIRNVVKHQRGGLSRIEKLEKLMVRIGIFSLLYTLPATVVLACHFYEQYYRKSWEAAAVCTGPCGFLTPIAVNNSRTAITRQSEYYIFIIKYFACLLVGVSSGIWVWTTKTWAAWKRFLAPFCSIFCYNNRPIPAYSPTEAIIIKSHTDLSGCYSKYYPTMKHV